MTERVGKFELVERIGAGAMGEVWRARDAGIGRTVALKLLKAANPMALTRFAREARLAASLEHPNIATVYEVDETADPPWIAMRLIDGVTLSGWRGSRRDLVTMMRDAARALQAAHERGIVHRDLKPDNLMIERGRIFVMDFGLAREMADESSLTGTGRIVGTPAFISPEQVRGATPDARGDVYSLGATFYAALTGRTPHIGENLLDMMMSAVEQRPRNPREVDATIPPDLDAVVMKCLEKDPRDRYPSMASLAEDLDRHLAGAAVGAHRRSLRLGPRAVFAGVGIAVVLAIAGGVAVWLKARTAGTGEVRRDALALLRETAKTCLDAALDQRRAGSREGMIRWAEKLEPVARQAQAEHPTLAEPHYVLGRMWRLMRRSGDALVEQEEALRKDPSFVPARYERMILMVGLYNRRVKDLEAAEKRRAGQGVLSQRDVALATVDELVAADPEASRFRQAALDDAAAITGHEAELAPGQAECLEAQRLAAAARWEDVERSLERAVKASSFVDEAFAELNRTTMRRKDFARAAEWASRALEADPTSIEWLHDRARAYAELAIRREWAGADGAELMLKALADADRAMELAPDNRLAGTCRAEMRSAMASLPRLDPEKAVEYCRQAIADYERVLDAGDAQMVVQLATTRLNLGHTLLRLNQPAIDVLKQAISEFEKATTLPGMHVNVWTGLGSARLTYGIAVMRSGKSPAEAYRLAMAALEKAVSIDPKCDRAWLELGRARSNVSGSLPPADQEALLLRAEADLTHSLTLNPRLTESVMLRARVRSRIVVTISRRQGDASAWYRSGLQDFEAALAIKVDLAGQYRDRGAHHLNYAPSAYAREEDAVAVVRLALADIETAIGMSSRDSVAWEFRGHANGMMGALLRLDGQDGDDWTRKAIDCYRRVAELDPVRKAEMDAMIRAQRKILGE